jgi:hypothetical protein
LELIKLQILGQSAKGSWLKYQTSSHHNAVDAWSGKYEIDSGHPRARIIMEWIFDVRLFTGREGEVVDPRFSLRAAKKSPDFASLSCDWAEHVQRNINKQFRESAFGSFNLEIEMPIQDLRIQKSCNASLQRCYFQHRMIVG